MLRLPNPRGLIAGVLVLACASIFDMGTSRAQSIESLVPASGTRQALDLQTALSDAGCYPPNTPTGYDRDRRFGGPGSNTYSRRAIQNWLTVNNKDDVSSYANSRDFLAAVKAGKNCPKAVAGECRRDSIDDVYLSRRTDIYNLRDLSLALDAAIANFYTRENSKTTDGFFPKDKGDLVDRDNAGQKAGGKGDRVDLDQSNRDAVVAAGGSIVTSATTLAALKNAQRQFRNLVLSYGLREPECANCGMVNDWLYLKNVARANAGVLIGRVRNAGPGGEKYAAFKVDNITDEMMSAVRANIYVIRTVSQRVNDLLTSSTPDPKRTKELLDHIDSEIFTIAEHFSNQPKGTSAGKAKFMRDVQKDSKCEGFKGNAIYQ